MRKEEFRTWLCQTKKLQASTAGSRISNCERIERCEGDLDILYQQDRLAALIGKLSYSKSDQQKHLPPRHAVPIDGDVYNGTATLLLAARLYKAFAGSDGMTLPCQYAIHAKSQKQVKSTGIWPTWDMPTPEIILKLTKMVTPHVRFLHPSIVEQIVEDNKRNSIEWREKLKSRGIDPDFYIWAKSSCAFPGIRRYKGRKERTRSLSRQTGLEITDALIIDDNSFPKHIWSFIFIGKPFQKSGPTGYALAHLADHQDYKNRRDNEFESVGPTPKKLYGLYSCASNTVYMPNSLLKLTDFNTQVRLLLLQKAQSLYGEFCNLLPPSYQLKTQTSQEWLVNNFKWCDPVGEGANLEEFFRFRSEKINSL